MTTSPIAVVNKNSHMIFEVVDGSYGLLSKAFRWEGIPPFAILTGLNGVGKTQILHGLASALGARDSEWRLGNLKVAAQLEGEGEIPAGVFLASEWPRISQGGTENVEGFRRSVTEFLDSRSKSEQHRYYDPYWRRLEMTLGKRREEITIDEVIQSAPLSLFARPSRNSLSSISRLFFVYYVLAMYSRQKGQTDKQIEDRLGPAPWDILNEILRTSELPFRVNSPEGNLPDLFGELSYTFELRDVRSNTVLNPDLLSSGERVIMSTALWRYTLDADSSAPHTLLLDEPDAHLHPSLIQHFLNVLQEEFVQKWGYRIILTTHSPTTAVLAPEGSLFEVARDPLRVLPVQTRWQTVDRLTEGFITIGPDTKTVFVEDVDDQRFYSRLFDELSRSGDTDEFVLETRPNLAFLPIHAAAPSATGGRTKIETLLKEVGPGTSIYGIADNDGNAKTVIGVHLTQRRMLENYIYDPLVIFGLLASRDNAPSISGLPPRVDERDIRHLSTLQQQAIIDYMLQALASTLDAEVVQATERVPVAFVYSLPLLYPRWFLEAHGKRHFLNQTFTQRYAGGIKREDLVPMYWRVKMFPSELADMMKKIQKPPL